MNYEYCCIEDNLRTCDLCNGKIDVDGHECENRRHKWPTLEEFENEWGRKYPDDGAVYELNESYIAVDRNWRATNKHFCFSDSIIVCACTPHARPDAEWRPNDYKVVSE